MPLAYLLRNNYLNCAVSVIYAYRLSRQRWYEAIERLTDGKALIILDIRRLSAPRGIRQPNSAGRSGRIGHETNSQRNFYSSHYRKLAFTGLRAIGKPQENQPALSELL